MCVFFSPRKKSEGKYAPVGISFQFTDFSSTMDTLPSYSSLVYHPDWLTDWLICTDAAQFNFIFWRPLHTGMPYACDFWIENGKKWCACAYFLFFIIFDGARSLINMFYLWFYRTIDTMKSTIRRSNKVGMTIERKIYRFCFFFFPICLCFCV